MHNVTAAAIVRIVDWIFPVEGAALVLGAKESDGSHQELKFLARIESDPLLPTRWWRPAGRSPELARPERGGPWPTTSPLPRPFQRRLRGAGTAEPARD